VDCYRFDKTIASEKTPQKEGEYPPLSDFSNPSKPLLILAGVDEVGRGPLAGPVVAAAVVLKEEPQIPGLRDSKAVPVEQREALFIEIKEEALASSIAIVSPVLIDELNILRASLKAMREAIQKLSLRPDLVLVDGNQKPLGGFKERAIIRGDSKSAAIMAASIVAKVTRDQIMMDLHEKYPQYGFNEHKGYGTKDHLEALNKFGPCEIHRRSFGPVKRHDGKEFISV